MTNTKGLSLWSAIIINVNIIVGSGLFINSTELAKRAGICGALSYAIVGLLLFPLILCFAQLLQLHPGGGFYSFCSRSVHPLAGFLSTWCYFATKLSSVALVIHIFILSMQAIVPFLAAYNPLILDVLLLSVLVGLNMLNVKTGSTIQGYITIIKLTPIALVFTSGIMYFFTGSFISTETVWSGIPTTIPLVLHAMLGFETACSISRNMQNPKVNAPKAVLISYSIVMLMYVMFQGLFYIVLGPQLAMQTDYHNAFPLLISTVTSSSLANSVLNYMVSIAIASSALGSGFGMIYANMWNLYSLAELRPTALPSKIVMSLNSFSIPFLCVLAEGIICGLYMFIINGERTTFQQLSGLGATLTYFLSIVGLIATLQQNKKNIVIPLLGLLNCILLMIASLYTMWRMSNPKPLCIFLTVATVGIAIYYAFYSQSSSKDEA
jgi:APA family basic amino acid/polyamine antiporter